MDKKTCNSCGVEKEIDKFSIKRRKKDGSPSYRENCKECLKSKDSEYYKNNAEKIKLRTKAYDTTDKAKARRSLYHIKKHGITLEEYELLKAKFDGLCWVCQESPGTVVDHDHKCCSGTFSCGKCVRGILCHQCNVGLGMFQDSIDRLQKAINYIS